MPKGFFNAYGDSLASIRLMDVVLAIVVGAVSGFLFQFVFPGAAISTLMHEVMELPGPGAGIGFIVGPYMILWGLIIWLHTRKAGVAFFAIAVSGIVQAYGPTAGVKSVLGPTVAPQMLLAAFVLAATVDLSAFGTRGWATWKGMTVTAVVTDIILMVVYWVAVFPSVKGWVQPVPAVILIVLSVAGAVLFGAVVPIVYSIITGRGKVVEPGEKVVVDDTGDEE